MRKLIVLAIAALVPVLAIAGYAAASERSEAARVASATARFHDLGAAKDAGYTVHVADKAGLTCIANGADGAMGDHFANGGLLFDHGVIDANRPEALVYETRNDGTFKLVALEYIVTQADWEGANGIGAARPKLFGQDFDFSDADNRFGLPPFYSLHAWIWKDNPSGLLKPWNPRVTCS
jgi:hypothetical protein